MTFEGQSISDPRAVRGMAHPLRLQILELLQQRGAMTATQVSDEVGESPANCSFHLRTLAKYGFIEEAPRGKGRTRPWRAVDYRWAVEEEDLSGDARRAAPRLGALIRQQAYERIDGWASERVRFPAKWRRAAFEQQVGVSMTAAELAKVNAGIRKLIEPYTNREKAPGDALSVAFYAWGFPTEDAEQRRERLSRK